MNPIQKYMKRPDIWDIILAVLVVFVLTICVAACGSDADPPGPPLVEKMQACVTAGGTPVIIPGTPSVWVTCDMVP